LRFLKTGNIYEFSEVARVVTPLILLGFVTKNLSVDGMFKVGFVVALINAVVVAMSSFGYSLAIFDRLVYSVASELSYGRASGIFSNIAVSGVMSAFLAISSYLGVLERIGSRALNSSTLLLASYSLVMSQSKTSILIALFIFISISVFYFLFSKRKVLPFFVCTVIAIIPIVFLDLILASFYTFNKLFAAQSILNISSLVARSDYWQEFLTLVLTDNSTLLFGVDKARADQVGSTFDNDYIWILVRFGLLTLVGVFCLYAWQLFQIGRYFSLSFSRKSAVWLAAFSFLASFLLGIFSTPALLCYILFWCFHESLTTGGQDEDRPRNCQL
jgi:hypothetical protein